MYIIRNFRTTTEVSSLSESKVTDNLFDLTTLLIRTVVNYLVVDTDGIVYYITISYFQGASITSEPYYVSCLVDLQSLYSFVYMRIPIVSNLCQLNLYNVLCHLYARFTLTDYYLNSFFFAYETYKRVNCIIRTKPECPDAYFFKTVLSIHGRTTFY